MKFIDKLPDTPQRGSKTNDERIDFLKQQPGKWAEIAEYPNSAKASARGHALQKYAAKRGIKVEKRVSVGMLYARIVPPAAPPEGSGKGRKENGK